MDFTWVLMKQPSRKGANLSRAAATNKIKTFQSVPWMLLWPWGLCRVACAVISLWEVTCAPTFGCVFARGVTWTLTGELIISPLHCTVLVSDWLLNHLTVISDFWLFKKTTLYWIRFNLFWISEQFTVGLGKHQCCVGVPSWMLEPGG